MALDPANDRVASSRILVLFNDDARHGSPAGMFACRAVEGAVADANGDVDLSLGQILANAGDLTMTTRTHRIVFFIVDVHDSFDGVGGRAFGSIEGEVPFSAAQRPRAEDAHRGGVRHLERGTAFLRVQGARLLCHENFLKVSLFRNSSNTLTLPTCWLW